MKRFLATLGGVGIGSISTLVWISWRDQNSVEGEDDGLSKFKKYGVPTNIHQEIMRSFVINYDNSKRNPNWVLEHLELGTKGNRSKSKFKEDSSILKKFRAHLQDYSNSGYDRGHLMPAADAANQAQIDESFLLSNISPQDPQFNRKHWLKVEKFTRNLKRDFDDVFVLTGALYLPKKIGDEYFVQYKVIGDPPQVAVPTHFFKAILAEKNGIPYLVCFLLPNSILLDKSLSEYVVPRDSIERSLGALIFPKCKNPKSLCSQTNCDILIR